MFLFKRINKKLTFSAIINDLKPISNKPSINCNISRIDSILKRLEMKNKENISKPIQSVPELQSKDFSKGLYRNKEVITEKEGTIPYLNPNLTFVDNENQFAFKIIDSLLRQQLSELSENIDNNSHSSDAYKKFFTISAEDFRDNSFVILDLIKVLKTLSFKQLSDVMESMTEWAPKYQPFDPLFYKLWSNLDLELETRLKKVEFRDNKEVNQYLWFGNLFYRLKVGNISKFNKLLVQKLSCPDFGLNKSSFLHLMFYMNLHRTIDPKAQPIVLRCFQNFISDMTLDEIGVICMTLFKTDTKLNENLINLIICKTLSDVSNETNNILRTAIIKCIRKSFHYKLETQFQVFIDKMKRLDNNSIFTFTHLLSLKTVAHIRDTDLMQQMFDKLYENPLSFRIKDIERIFLCFSHFDYKPDFEKLESICDKLHLNEKSVELYQYPICLLNILHYLSSFHFYPKPLIERCFNPDFLDKILKYSKLDFQRHLLVVNTSLSIEKYDEFKHVLLPTEKVYRYHRWILSDERAGLAHMTKKTLLLNQVYMSLQTELHQRVKLCHILPFRSYPFVVIFNEKIHNFSLTPNTELRQNMFNNCFAIYILDIKDYSVVDTTIKGSVRLEIELLEALGFKVVAIPWHQLMSYSTSNGKRNKIIAEVNKIDPNFIDSIKRF